MLFPGEGSGLDCHHRVSQILVEPHQEQHTTTKGLTFIFILIRFLYLSDEQPFCLHHLSTGISITLSVYLFIHASVSVCLFIHPYIYFYI